MTPLGDNRRSLVTALLQEHGAVTVTELQARLGVSPMTVRRDLSILADRGVARRTHGGAVVPRVADDFGSAAPGAAPLAEAAFALLAPGETVFLDATTCSLARLIAQSSLPLRVITNALPVLHELTNGAAVDVVAVGDTLLDGCFVGPV